MADLGQFDLGQFDLGQFELGQFDLGQFFGAPKILNKRRPISDLGQFDWQTSKPKT